MFALMAYNYMGANLGLCAPATLGAKEPICGRVRLAGVRSVLNTLA